MLEDPERQLSRRDTLRPEDATTEICGVFACDHAVRFGLGNGGASRIPSS